jgi:hypothetical protein
MWVMAAAGLIPAALWTVWMRLRPSREVPKLDGDADEGWNVWEST